RTLSRRTHRERHGHPGGADDRRDRVDGRLACQPDDRKQPAGVDDVARLLRDRGILDRQGLEAAKARDALLHLLLRHPDRSHPRNPRLFSRLSRRASHQPYCCGHWANSGSAPSAAAACRGQLGSNSASRPTAITSARPSCSACSACCAVRMSPTAMVAMPASFLTLSEKGNWNPGTRLIRVRVAAVAEPWIPPEEQSTTSTPSFFSPFANASVSSMLQPPSTSSIDEQRTKSGLESGHALRTSATTCSGKRMRPSSEPPYSSCRVLESGERNV